MGARHPHAGMMVGFYGGHIFLAEDDASFFGGINAVDGVEQRGFAGAVRPDQPEDLAFREIKGHICERLQTAKAFGYPLHR